MSPLFVEGTAAALPPAAEEKPAPGEAAGGLHPKAAAQAPFLVQLFHETGRAGTLHLKARTPAAEAKAPNGGRRPGKASEDRAGEGL